MTENEKIQARRQYEAGLLQSPDDMPIDYNRYMSLPCLFRRKEIEAILRSLYEAETAKPEEPPAVSEIERDKMAVALEECYRNMASKNFSDRMKAVQKASSYKEKCKGANNPNSLYKDEFTRVLKALAIDKSAEVRKCVAQQKECRDILISDKSADVRLVLAKQGYNLPRLVNDKSPRVRACAKAQAENKKKTRSRKKKKAVKSKKRDL